MNGDGLFWVIGGVGTIAEGCGSGVDSEFGKVCELEFQGFNFVLKRFGVFLILTGCQERERCEYPGDLDGKGSSRHIGEVRDWQGRIQSPSSSAERKGWSKNADPAPTGHRSNDR